MSIRPSAVTIEIRSTDRRIRLLKGEALFTVAPDRSRPFTVQAAIGETMALGTQFSVRRTGADTEVTVTEHSVMLVSGEGKGASLILREGQSIRYGADSRIDAPRSINTEAATAWTDGVLVFKDAPLCQVVAEIGRYHPGYMTIVGDASSLHVCGVFRIDDPVAAISRLQKSLGLRSVQLSRSLIVIFA